MAFTRWRDHPQLKPYLALAAVCFFWGTTFLAIRVALETIPPLTLLATRFLTSGTILLTIAALTGATLPRGRELFFTGLYGLLPLGVSSGALAFAQREIPSSLAALYITTSPLWTVLIEALIPGGERLRRRTVAAMLVGFAGTALLVFPRNLQEGFSAANVRGFLILQVGNIAWGLGAILFRRRSLSESHTTVAHPIVSGAVQQFVTGALTFGIAWLVPHTPVVWSTRGVLAVLYLVTFGSIVGYSAYIYVLGKLPVSIVSLYTYVNPVVAVTLGWIFYREPAGWRELSAMVIIFYGVYLVKRSQRH
ncbi:MAG: EamA family transporter [Bryobacteraceae bacterium]|nr:EamA family transporter [Bryobacteraceae bacterium]